MATAPPPAAAVPSTAPAPSPSPDPGKGVRFPLAPPQRKPAAAAAVRVPIRIPTPQPDLPAPSAGGASTLEISYQVQPHTTLEHTFDTTNWTSLEAVDYGILYRTLEAGGTTSLTAAASLWDRLADISLGLTTDTLWRDRLDPSQSEAGSADWQSLITQDLQQDHLNLRSTLQTTVRPFLGLTALSSSTLLYRLGVNVYQLAWDQVSTATPAFVAPVLAWNPGTIAEHSLTASLGVNLPSTTDTFSLAAQLPPLAPTLSGSAAAGVGPLRAKLQAGLSQPASGGVVYQPVIGSLGFDFGNGFSGGEELQYDIASATLQRATSTIQAGPFSGSFVGQWMLPVDGLGNLVPGGTLGLLPYTAKLGYETASNPRWFWKDRVKMDLSLKTHWALNLQNFTNNLFDFSLALNLNIFKALDLTFSSLSTNSTTYRYIPGWANAVGEAWVNPLQDLANSFDFFNTAARQTSGFKIKTLSLSATQHFPDWDLNVQYQGSPQLRTNPADGRQEFIWTPTFSILVQWNAVPEVKSNIQGTYTGVTLR